MLAFQMRQLNFIFLLHSYDLKYNFFQLLYIFFDITQTPPSSYTILSHVTLFPNKLNFANFKIGTKKHVAHFFQISCTFNWKRVDHVRGCFMCFFVMERHKRLQIDFFSFIVFRYLRAFFFSPKSSLKEANRIFFDYSMVEKRKT